ncbi:diaminopimelate epimerase [Lachnospiraceae bacterium 54-53]
MKFTKMQGIGNDYVYINCFEEQVEDPAELSKKVSDRHFGIGSDGLILICPSKKADCRMRMFNADGSESQMCGNGIRCVGKYVYDRRMVDKTEFDVETEAGIKRLQITEENGRAVLVTVDMGVPEITGRVPEPIRIDGMDYEFIGVSMGNPHAVYYMDDIDSLDLESMGPSFENHERFPERTNSEFIEVVNPGYIRMRVWERGSGETYACGTGAAASAVASALSGRTLSRVEVELKGGNLTIFWDREGSGHAFMTGPATEVFEGTFEIKNL